MKADNVDLLNAQIKSKTLSGVYILTGEEQYQKDFYVKRIKEQFEQDGFGDFNIAVFEGSGHSPDSIRSYIEAFPLMAEKKLLVIKDSNVLKSPPEPLKKMWEDVLQSPPSHAVIIFDEKQIDKRLSIYKAVTKAGLFVEFNLLAPERLKNWAAGWLNKRGMTIQERDLEYLLLKCEPGMVNLVNEMEKLTAHCTEGNIITKQAIDLMVPKSVQNHLYDMIDAVGEGKNAQAFAMLADLKVLKEPPIKIIVLLGMHVAKVLKAKLLNKKGGGDLAKALGVPPFAVRKYTHQASLLSERFLMGALESCKTADYMIKSGKLDEWTALELLMVELCRVK